MQNFRNQTRFPHRLRHRHPRINIRQFIRPHTATQRFSKLRLRPFQRFTPPTTMSRNTNTKVQRTRRNRLNRHKLLRGVNLPGKATQHPQRLIATNWVSPTNTHLLVEPGPAEIRTISLRAVLNGLFTGTNTINVRKIFRFIFNPRRTC